jgi:ketosteroid isomerase-like protein
VTYYPANHPESLDKAPTVSTGRILPLVRTDLEKENNMNRLKAFILAAIAAGLLSACAPPNPPATNTTNANINANANANRAAAPAAPSKEALASLEKQAFEAWKNKDGKFFDGFLASNFMMMDDNGQHFDKAAAVKAIGENPCEVKSYSMSDEQVTPVSADVAVITMKITADGTCGGKPMPNPVTSSSVYIKQGSDWKAVFHSEVPIVDPKAMADKKMPAPPPAAKAPAAPAGNADMTAKLLAREKEGWDAWKNHDQAKLTDFVADTAYGVGMMGERMNTKADILKAWMEPCTVDNVVLSNEHAVEIAPGVAMLMYKGTATGKCGDMEVKPEWATTLYKQNGDKWQGVFFVASPA